MVCSHLVTHPETTRTSGTRPRSGVTVYTRPRTPTGPRKEVNVEEYTDG